MNWCPNSSFDFILMDEDVKDEEVIKLFVEYHNMPLIVIDILTYSKKVLNINPNKITNRGIVFYINGYKVELEIHKEIINIYKFLLQFKNKSIEYKLIDMDIFSYKNFFIFCQK